MKLIIAGDSHVLALTASLRRQAPSCLARIPQLSDIASLRLMNLSGSLSPFHAVEEQGVVLTPPTSVGFMTELLGENRFHADAHHLYAFMFGYSTSLFVLLREWNYFHPWRFAGDTKVPLSTQAIAQMARHYFRHIFAFYADLQKQGVSFFVLESPPLRHDHQGLANFLSPEAMLEVDAIVRAAVDTTLHAMGIDTVPCAAMGYEGTPRHSFMKPEFYKRSATDFHHATGVYGKHRVDDIMEYLARRFSA